MKLPEKQLQNIIEGALLASSEPLKVEHLQALFDEEEMPENEEVDVALQTLARECEGRGYALIEVASGWRFQVRQDLARWINRLWEEKPQRYSRALLETLALIAYRQPITRGDIEDVRGVAVSSHIIKTLTEREWVKVVGHRDVPGRPALYATTRHFLDYFNMKSLDELPSLGELKDIDSLNKNLEFEAAMAEIGAALPTDEEPGSDNRDQQDNEQGDLVADDGQAEKLETAENLEELVSQEEDGAIEDGGPHDDTDSPKEALDQ